MIKDRYEKWCPWSLIRYRSTNLLILSWKLIIRPRNTRLRLLLRYSSIAHAHRGVFVANWAVRGLFQVGVLSNPERYVQDRRHFSTQVRDIKGKYLLLGGFFAIFIVMMLFKSDNFIRVRGFYCQTESLIQWRKQIRTDFDDRHDQTPPTFFHLKSIF